LTDRRVLRFWFFSSVLDIDPARVMMVQWALLALSSAFTSAISLSKRPRSIWSRQNSVLISSYDLGSGAREGSRAMEIEAATDESMLAF
jgi:hypothetical protein